MWKVFAILSLILFIVVVILILIIKFKNKDINSFKSENETLRTIYEELNKSYTNLNKEMEIEKKHTQELAKKLADISCMSIDDVMHQLQDNDSNRKDNI
jgi:predicted Holliday junction resolvase-like endonuclease